MSHQDSLAMATSAGQRQHSAGHAMPAGKAMPHEQIQVGVATAAHNATPYSWLCRCPMWGPHTERRAMPGIILLCCFDNSQCRYKGPQVSMQALDVVAYSSRNAWLCRKHSIQPRTRSQRC